MSKKPAVDPESPFAHHGQPARDPDALSPPPEPGCADRDDMFLIPNFVPVPLRERSDGWTPARQVAFIEALAQTACVDQAARSVGLSARSAYKLRQHAFAAPFRRAWDQAIEYAVQRLADAALSRAIHGVARPVFYRGEQVGERRYYDERLTQFILARRDPARWGKAIDTLAFNDIGDGLAMGLAMDTLAIMRQRDEARRPAAAPAKAAHDGGDFAGDVSRTLRTSGADDDETDGDALRNERPDDDAP
jgi:hypothetical protein